MTDFTLKVIDLIKQIPYGSISTYGTIAAQAGNPRAARQVAYILHSCSEKYDLPWHRVVAKDHRIKLSEHQGLSLQKSLLENEGFLVTSDGIVSHPKTSKLTFSTTTSSGEPL